MSVHLLLSAGRGPQECAWAVARLLDRLETDARRRDVAVARLESVPGERPGTCLSVLLRLSGPDAEGFAAGWTGTLCWQAPSPYRASAGRARAGRSGAGRSGAGRKNWYVTARRCEVDTPAVSFAEDEVDLVPCRTGGPGGQHRNKASTAVRATHRPSGIVVVVDTERKLSLNRAIALRLIRERLEEAGAAAGRAVTRSRWRLHDELVRGDPVRVERP